MFQLQKCETLEELATHFDDKLSSIRQKLLLRNGFDEDNKQRGEELLQGVGAILQDLAGILKSMKMQLSQKSSGLEHVEVSRSSIFGAI